MVRKWYKARGTLYGWSKRKSALSRHRALRKSVKREGYATTTRKLIGLANVTRDRYTERIARADARWLRSQYRK